MSLFKQTQSNHSIDSSRRDFLRKSLATSLGGVALLGMNPSWASIAPAREHERILSFNNLHTGERLKTVYWQEGEYIPDAMAEINQVLRDHRSGEVYPMDQQLMDLLYALQDKVDGRGFEVISGYRSPKTNANLRANSSGVAKRSLHMQGRAIDIRIPGRDLKTVQQAALSLRGGGVGYYAKSNFLHIDTGRVRRW